MYSKIKVFHLLGVVLFFGSILAHTVASIFATFSNNAQTLFIVRQVMQMETNYLLIPGLVLFFLSGISMILVAKHKLKKMRWLLLHAVVGVLIILNAVFILLPAGTQILELSQLIARNNLPMDQLMDVKKTESIFGGINLLLCMFALILGVLKPKFGNK